MYHIVLHYIYIVLFYIFNEGKARLELHLEALKAEKSGLDCKILFSFLKLLRVGEVFAQIRISGLWSQWTLKEDNKLYIEKHIRLMNMNENIFQNWMFASMALCPYMCP